MLIIDKNSVYIAVGCGKDKIIEHLGNNYNYVEQKKQLGTGHAVMECAKAVDGFDGSVLCREIRKKNSLPTEVLEKAFADFPGKQKQALEDREALRFLVPPLRRGKL